MMKKQGRPPKNKPKAKKGPMIYNTVYRHKEGMIIPLGWYIDKKYTTKSGAERRLKALKKMTTLELSEALDITEKQTKSLQLKTFCYRAKRNTVDE